MKKITIALYQKPDAKPHVDYWYNEMKDKIVEHLTLKNSTVFNIQDKEYLILMPIGAIDEPLINTMLNLYGKFHKLLIFGKVTGEQLEFINKKYKEWAAK